MTWLTRIRAPWLVLLLLAGSGCTPAMAIVAMNRSVDAFRVYPTDPRVRYEEGAEAIARMVAENLDSAIGAVEQRQFAPFARPVRIYVPATVDRFSEFCVQRRAGGCVLNGRLFLSPKKENTEERIPGLLAHELSHLHMEQYLGMWRWNANVPSWFREGLAVHVSGAGAEKVTADEAIQAMRQGLMIVPNASGSPLFPRTAHSFGLRPHMFYRQSAMFVSWLARRPDRFRRFLETLRAGVSFEGAMQAAYGTGVAGNWKCFVEATLPRADSLQGA